MGRSATSQDDFDERVETADVRALSLEVGRRVSTRFAGLFLFLPMLARMRFDGLVAKAGYPGTKMIPAGNALLSLLSLTLVDKERLSHIDDFNCDEALGLFAGLNVLPKKSYATDYSYRTKRDQQLKLLKNWIGKLSPLVFPEADSFSLDFHPIGQSRGGHRVGESLPAASRNCQSKRADVFRFGAQNPCNLLCKR